MNAKSQLNDDDGAKAQEAIQQSFCDKFFASLRRCHDEGARHAIRASLNPTEPFQQESMQHSSRSASQVGADAEEIPLLLLH